MTRFKEQNIDVLNGQSSNQSNDKVYSENGDVQTKCKNISSPLHVDYLQNSFKIKIVSLSA